ncbi:MAG: hypothetical protein A4E47_00029 [Methanosaeta sp. PtaU1.Bin028]|nr:MAG: hypothetical protein A4E47_00029 [Methanosaeta sp. PtaU1.Bin028]
MVEVDPPVVGAAELVVNRHELSFGLHKIVQDATKAQIAAFEGNSEQLLCPVQIRIIEDGTFSASLS